MTKRCKKGEIRRKAYITKNGTVVPSACIKDRGNPGKGPKVIPPLKKGTLTKYGYSTKFRAARRHAALKKAIEHEGGATTVIRKLNAVAVLNKNTNPEVSSILRQDMKWVQDFDKKSDKVNKIPPLKKGTLKQYGYSTKSRAARRRTTLRKAVKSEGAASVIRMLNAVAILNKNKNPKVSAVLRDDLKWVQDNYTKKSAKKPSKKSVKKPSKKAVKKPSKKSAKKMSKEAILMKHMTVKDLQKAAREMEIKGRSKMNRKKLVAALA